MSFSPQILALATRVIETATHKQLILATAESCTGGLIAGALTAIPGSSAVVDRGFVTYSNEAKTQMLGIPSGLIGMHGAVSSPVAQAMASGALNRSNAHRAVAVTGIAGPGGGSALKPEGLVWFGFAQQGKDVLSEEKHFGAIGRDNVRSATVQYALRLLLTSMED
ncbi:MAG: CinA family protein [Neomegalonema sp.]|nr:CinA family protein [Neomegalonema sp.]